MSQPSEPTESAAKPFIIALTVAAAVAAGYTYYHYVLSPQEKSETTTAQSISIEQTPVIPAKPQTEISIIFDEPEHTIESPSTNTEPEIQTAPVDLLPTLDNSDSVAHSQIEELLSSSFASGLDSSLVMSDEFIRKLVLTIDNLSRGEISNKYPAARIRVEPFDQSVTALKPHQDPPRYTMGQDIFKRYDRAVNIFSAVDKAALASLYQWIQPLLQQSYDELGNAKMSFDTVAIKAIDQLLSAPNIEGDIELKRPSVMFQYADPALEKSSASDKLMFRLGPDNRSKFKAALRELKAELNRL